MFEDEKFHPLFLILCIQIKIIKKKLVVYQFYLLSLIINYFNNSYILHM